MIKSEEHKLDKLQKELLNIENLAKNLDLNSKDEYRMVLTNIVSENKNIPKNSINSDLIQNLNNIKLNLNQQIQNIDNILKNLDK